MININCSKMLTSGGSFKDQTPSASEVEGCWNSVHV